jgi:wyosine [tRNA(Phe)-imidazoG37] synthetase (radical SAM superfamily)
MSDTKLNLFTQHSRSWRQNLYVYPVVSRRSHGLSIGINLNPDKACNFDCVYCCVDRSVPPTVREVDLATVRSELEHMVHLATSGQLFAEPPFDQTPAALRRLNDVAFSGDGEPTACPHFAQACRLVSELVHQQSRRPDVKIVVITNATLFHRPPVAEALALLDQHNGEIWAKLDAGTEDYYRQIERTTIPFQRVLDNIAAAGRIRPVVIQSLFLKLHGIPPTLQETDAYVQRLRDLRQGGCQIKLVQVYTVARTTAEAYVAPLEAAALDAIAANVKAAGFDVQTYYGPS